MISGRQWVVLLLDYHMLPQTRPPSSITVAGSSRWSEGGLANTGLWWRRETVMCSSPKWQAVVSRSNKCSEVFLAALGITWVYYLYLCYLSLRSGGTDATVDSA